MLFSRDFITTVLALAFSATRAEAAIAIVMWVDGGDPCRWTIINNRPANPCNVHLANPLTNWFKYVLQGYGGSLWLNNDYGSFNSYCHDAPANLACGVRREWVCC
ncbi:uncharacterized protein Triagg1_3562 [Trichoderma aggressivum f. europaeum]|uniref:Uncharacterized protein n=1 Tax=Trichoderma aggressivum f. europaeum TaxID=173218 RepID=A0AAE1M6X7_9HYPO|nr:hypothetical protein Triagg1_3562 [Trichoderma aggressivum f. europaeum]